VSRDLSQILDKAIEQLREGESSEAVLARFPQEAPELQALVAIASELNVDAHAVLPYEARLSLAAGQREFELFARQTLASPTRLRRRGAGRPFNSGMAVRRFASVMALLLVMFLGVSAVTTASASSLPGDRLYVVKRVGEDVRLALAFTPNQRSQVLLAIANERLFEVREITRQGRTVDAETIRVTIEAFTTNLDRAYETASIAPDVQQDVNRDINRLLNEAKETLGSVAAQTPQEQEAIAIASSHVEEIQQRIETAAPTTTATAVAAATGTPEQVAQGPTGDLETVTPVERDGNSGSSLPPNQPGYPSPVVGTQPSAQPTNGTGGSGPGDSPTEPAATSEPSAPVPSSVVERPLIPAEPAPTGVPAPPAPTPEPVTSAPTAETTTPVPTTSTPEPTLEPTLPPEPTVEPADPVSEPDNKKPTPEPTTPTVEPTTPTVEPTTPTVEPTTPTVEPTTPTVEPTDPTAEPTTEPTSEPTTEPTSEPTSEPTTEPTSEPTTELTAEPTDEPTTELTAEPTDEPTETPNDVVEAPTSSSDSPPPESVAPDVGALDIIQP
jgi:ElaB/YqjD/DUF883 family membrane-anchored ribosome-binding protein